MTEQQLQHVVVDLLMGAARERAPREFQGFLGGIVGNVVGNLPQHYFDQLVIASPCGRHGCDCHEIAAPFLASLKAIRDDHNRTIALHRQ